MIFYLVTQDGICEESFTIDSILDPKTQAPTWSMLVSLLNLSLETKLLFRVIDPTTNDNKFQVSNDRHLRACITYFSNKNALIVEITERKT